MNRLDLLSPDSIQLQKADYEAFLGERLSPFLDSFVNEKLLEYRPLFGSEYDGCVREIHTELLTDIQKSGEKRLPDWERGWRENLEEFRSTLFRKALIPKYFKKHLRLRLGDDLIEPLTENFEYRMLEFYQYGFFDRYFKDLPAIYEFGCGTGHNLLRARAVNSSCELWGLDWAGSVQSIFDEIRQSEMEKNIFFESFDLFRPNNDFQLIPEAGVLTVASLEQLGRGFRPFVNYLLSQKPRVCIHMEPIVEFLDPAHHLDALSIRYIEKRGYLWGLLDYLKELETQGEIRILQAQRNTMGSLPIQPYSLVIWEPSRS